MIGVSIVERAVYGHGNLLEQLLVVQHCTDVLLTQEILILTCNSVFSISEWFSEFVLNEIS
jgi:hypothetical protein